MVLSGRQHFPGRTSIFSEFTPGFHWVLVQGVTGSKHISDTSMRLVRYPSLVVAEQAGHSVESVVTATNPHPLGPTVTCRDGTCVHLPGYCQDCEPPRTGSALPYTWSQGARSNCQAYDSEGENPGNGHFHYWMLTRTCFTFASSGQT